MRERIRLKLLTFLRGTPNENVPTKYTSKTLAVWILEKDANLITNDFVLKNNFNVDIEVRISTITKPKFTKHDTKSTK